MSDRPCNRCDYARRQQEAKRQGLKLRLVPDSGARAGSAFPWVRVERAAVGTTEWTYAEVSYAEMPDRCAC
jgi:hypothetical protein